MEGGLRSDLARVNIEISPSTNATQKESTGLHELSDSLLCEMSKKCFKIPK